MGELMELYFELMFMVFPSARGRTGIEILFVMIAFIVVLGLSFMFYFGYSFIKLERIESGVTLIVIASIITLVQIIAGIVLYKKHN